MARWDMSKPHVDDELLCTRIRSSYHAESENAYNERAVLTSFVLTLVALKVVTSVMILYVFPSFHALIVVMALSLIWIVAGVVYGGAYSRIKLRMLRVRARRRQLIFKEWNVD